MSRTIDLRKICLKAINTALNTVISLLTGIKSKTDQLTFNGDKLKVDASVIIDTSGLATSDNQTNGDQKTQITDGAGTVNTKQLGDQLTILDVGLITNTIIHGKTTAGGGSYVDVKVNPSGSLTVDTGLNQPLTDIELRATPIEVFGNLNINTNGLATSDNQTNGEQLAQPYSDIADDYAPNQSGVTGLKQTLQVDPSGQAMFRGAVLSDEESFRDDFNDVLLSEWVTYSLGNGASVTQADSKVFLNVGNGPSKTYISKEADYLPANITFNIKQSDINTDLLTQIGWIDDPAAPTKGTIFLIENNIISCKSFTQNDSFNEEIKIVSIPLNGLLTEENIFTISLESSQVTYLINNEEVATHKNHIPNPYDFLQTFIYFENLGTAPSCFLNCDYVFFQNINQLEITNNFKPLQVELTGNDQNGNKKKILVDEYGTLPVNFPEITLDSGGRMRTGQITTLFDGKVLNQDRTILFDNQGTGTGTHLNNGYLMSVTPGQYRIRQQKFYNSYFSGKSQLIELTFENFQAENGIKKRVGYYSSNNLAPWDSNLDGFWLESGEGTINGTIDLVISNAGTETKRIPIETWGAYQVIKNYDWSKFTVIVMDFLWLGGANLRLFLKFENKYLLVNTYVHAGKSSGIMTESPNHPVRYEIRSSTGTNSFKYCCSMVGTEGSVNEAGLISSIPVLSTPITLASTANTYPIRAIRKNASLRDIAVTIVDCNIFTGSNSDQGIWSLQLNPILSAPLNYISLLDSAIQYANGNSSITVTNPGRILASGFQSLNQVLQAGNLKDSYLSYLGSTLNDTMDQVVLCFQPIAGTPISAYGTISFKEF